MAIYQIILANPCRLLEGHLLYHTVFHLLRKFHKCRELKKFNPNSFITIVVRGEPIISDATLKDVQELNFNEVVDEILTTGCFAIGVDFNLLPPKLERAIKRADLIICKGMANYEAFSETKYGPIAYLLRTKCSAIANSMKISLDVNAIKVYYT